MVSCALAAGPRSRHVFNGGLDRPGAGNVLDRATVVTKDEKS